MEKSYKQYLAEIRMFIFDIDGVLTNGLVTIMPGGELVRQMNIKDGYALKTAVDMGFHICIISGGKNEGVRIRLKNLGIKDIFLGAQNKIQPYQELLENYNIPPRQILYMGDDLPDIPVMKLVGLPCCPKDAASEVQRTARYISDRKGGDGCVRDIIEQVLRVQGKWNENFDASDD